MVRSISRALLVVLAVVCTTGPVRAQQVQPPPRDTAAPRTTEVHLRLRPSPAREARSFREFDRVVRAVGMRPMREDTLPPGRREVRAWIGHELGYPRHMYRLRMDGARVDGALYHYWAKDADPAEPDSMSYHALIRRDMRGPCGPIATGQEVEVCPGQFTAAPDWAGIAADAEAAGLWTLPDEATLPGRGFVLDGWTILVEVRAGSDYHVYRYASPSPEAGPEHANAQRIAHAFGRALGGSRTSEVVRRYRGLARTGPSLQEFRPCAWPETWELRGSLRGLEHGWTAAPPPDSAGVRQQYVEVEGSLAPGWLVRRWGSEHPRVLRAGRVVEAREWTPDVCAGAAPPEIIP